jgi:VCBS repeat-containing protein
VLVVALLVGASLPVAAHAAPPPQANDDAYATGVNAVLTVAAPGVLGNDDPPTGLTAAVVTKPEGDLTLNPDGSFTYSPDPDFKGPDDFTYKASEGTSGSSPPATVTITVDDPPTANGDSYVTGVNQQLVVGVSGGLLTNDTDPNGDPLTAVVPQDSGPSHGTLALNSTGSFTYTPVADFEGTDQFTYRAADSLRQSDPATVTITVDDPPAATDDPYTAHRGQSINVAAAQGVLANDSDPDSADTLQAVLDTDVAHGSLTLNADGSFTYTPGPGFDGSDGFTYHASDGALSSGTATVSIDVMNDPPVAFADRYGTRHATTLTRTAATGVLANDRDTNGDTLTAVLDTGVSNGSLTLNPDGSFTYTPDRDFQGTDQFTYHAVDDATPPSSSALVAVELVVWPDRAPVANDDNYKPIRARSGLHANILTNDTDSDPGDAGHLQPVLVIPPRFGHLDMAANGDITYRPDPGNCNRTELFTYRAFDGLRRSNRATVTIPIVTPLATTALSLDPSTGRVTYGGSVRLTAHLTRFSPSARVSIYRTPMGGAQTLVTRRQPDANGDIVVRVKPSLRTTYVARSTHDNCFQAGTSASEVVRVAPVVRGRMVGSFATRAGYALYHAGGRAPLYRATVSPDHTGDPVTFVWQRHADGRWKSYLKQKVTLGDNSMIGIYLKQGVVRGVRYRVRIRFLSDGDHLARAAKWSYFKAV